MVIPPRETVSNFPFGKVLTVSGFSNRLSTTSVTLHLCSKSVQSVQHVCCNQLLLDVPFNPLGEKLAQVGAALAMPGRTCKNFHRRAEHLGRGIARFWGNLNA